MRLGRRGGDLRNRKGDAYSAWTAPLARNRAKARS